MGESEKQPIQLSFNRFLRVAFQEWRVTSNGGLILVRELDERLGFGGLIEEHLTDSRTINARFSFADLLRQSVYSRLAGYEDVNDAERLSWHPALRLMGSEKIWQRGAALTSRLQSFETELLTQEENFAGLASMNRKLVAKAETILAITRCSRHPYNSLRVRRDPGTEGAREDRSAGCRLHGQVQLLY